MSYFLFFVLSLKFDVYWILMHKLIWMLHFYWKLVNFTMCKKENCTFHKNKQLTNLIHLPKVFQTYLRFLIIAVSGKWKWKLLSLVWLFATPWTWNSLDQNTGVGSLSFLQGIFPTQGSNPGLPHCGQILLPAEPPGKPKNTGVGSLSLLQLIFPIQESNWGPLHCRRILYQLIYQGSPKYLW